MISRLLTLIILLALLGSQATSIGLSYADNQVFADGYVDFRNIGPLYQSAYPCARSNVKSSLQTSYRQLYGIKELTDNKAAATIRMGRFNIGAAFSSFGEPDYFHQLGLSGFGSYQVGKFSIGSSVLYHRLDFDERFGSLSLLSINIGASYSHNRLLAYAVTRSVNQPRYYENAPPINPEGEIGLSLISGDGLDSQVKALLIRNRQPTAEILQSFGFSPVASVNWSLVLKPVRFGAGFALTHRQLKFEYKFSHHPVLGATHTVSLLIF